MTSNQDIYAKFKKILEEPIVPESPDNPEMVSPLFHNDWIRILLVRNSEKPDILTIEIESSLPLKTQGLHKDAEDGLHARKLLQGMIETLEYLLQLEEAGFSLDIIGQDCMWTAYFECSESPTKEFFKRIQPKI